MRLIAFQLTLLLFFTITCSGQVSSCDTIYWTPKIKLTWVDFKARPDTTVVFGAISSSATGYKSKLRNDTIRVWTYCRFLTCNSWTKFNSANLLKHEQTHFDIAEYCRRLFIQKISLSNLNLNNAIDVVNEFHKDVVKFRDILDKKYDKETNLSMNELMQDKWTRDIQNKILTLRKFNQPDIIIALK